MGKKRKVRNTTGGFLFQRLETTTPLTEMEETEVAGTRGMASSSLDHPVSRGER